MDVLRPQARQKSHREDYILTLQPFSRSSSRLSRPSKVTIKCHLKDSSASGAIAVFKTASHVVKVYDTTLEGPATEFTNEKVAYELIGKSEARKHIPQGFQHGTVVDFPCHQYNMIDKVPGTTLDLVEASADSEKQAIMKNLIEADSEILFLGQVTIHDLHPQNVTLTLSGKIVIVDFGQSTIEKKIPKEYRNPLFCWVRRARLWAEYGWFRNRREGLKWMWDEWGPGGDANWASVNKPQENLTRVTPDQGGELVE
ncbi:hypothetical protein FB567DRAFT_612890 [Paraphoma chrysanthemicola]|uniref:ABC1 atypical kinase-like domain-containing protein n=1 Tax=Paraphoma chrysanthemicola TaxID=798071 RepID=A0A8K0QT79_9PLEO|nr:hypothetical protein FB567DRAFT_612890 [Paraphoma chrysanthemicola]